MRTAKASRPITASARSASDQPERISCRKNGRWYGASSDGFGATYCDAAEPIPASVILTATVELGAAAERYSTRYSLASVVPSDE